MPDVQLDVPRDTAPELVRLGAVHAGIVAVPVFVMVALVVALASGNVAVAVVVGIVVALAAGVAATVVRSRGADDRVVAMVGTRPIGSGDDPRLAGLADNVAMAVGVATPRLFLIDSPNRNALSWGDGTGPVCVALTTGLVGSADRIQLEAVLARQLTVARAGCADVVTIATVLFGSLTQGRLAAVVASLTQRGVDDRSVVRADLDGARATRYPPGLVAALELVHAGPTAVASVPVTMSGLCLVAPDDRIGPFSVHPGVEDRIDLLRQI